jgi:hypothetical protein
MYQDLEPLIALLKKASASNNPAEQLATIELGLVAAEFGEEYDFIELMSGLAMLSELKLTGRLWNATAAADTELLPNN